MEQLANDVAGLNRRKQFVHITKPIHVQDTDFELLVWASHTVS